MADDAENIRKQIQFLTGLIENANRSRNKQETKTTTISESSNLGYTLRSNQQHLHQIKSLRTSQQSRNDSGTSSKYSWNKSGSVGGFHSSGISVPKTSFENRVSGKIDSVIGHHQPKTSNDAMPRVKPSEKLKPTEKSLKPESLTYHSHNNQDLSKSKQSSKTLVLAETKTMAGNLKSTDQKESTAKSGRNLSSGAHQQTETKPFQIKPNKVSTKSSVRTVDDKLKLLSNSLKDELKKTEEQINLLKQNLTEQKSLIKLKQQLKDQKHPLSGEQNIEKVPSNTGFEEDRKNPFQFVQTESAVCPPVGSPVRKTSRQDNYISKSPYKLVKYSTSPVATGLACHGLELDETRKSKTNYEIHTEMSASGSKALVKSEMGIKFSENEASNGSVFKKTKYTLRRVKSEPGSKYRNEKTPTKFLRISKYSIKRVRRSLSNKSNEEAVKKGRFKMVNTLRSHRQSVAKFIKSKYKVHSITAQRTFKWKQPSNFSKAQLYNPYRPRSWKPRWEQVSYDSRNGPFCHYQNKLPKRYMQHRSFSQNYMKVSRYMPARFFMERFCQLGRTYRQGRQRRLQDLKKTVPFNPKLKTDHRKTANERLRMIDGVVYRSTGRKLVKESFSGPGSKILPSSLKFRKTQVIQGQPRAVSNSEKNQMALYQSSSLRKRLAAAQLMNKSIAMATAKYKKDNTKKKYCMFYNRFGKCNRKNNCPFIHDPEKIAVCTRFLRGTCKVKDCAFSHKVSKEKMPVCSYFLRGKCTKDDCPYLHVNVNKDAEICEDFVNGFCPLGDQCKNKHTLVCPVFAQTGSCPKGKKCKLQHRKTRKRKVTQSDKTEPDGKQMKLFTTSSVVNSSAPVSSQATNCDKPTTSTDILRTWTRIMPAVGGERAPVVLDSSDEETDDSLVPFKDRKLPTYISLNLREKMENERTTAGLERVKEQTPTTMKIRPQL